VGRELHDKIRQLAELMRHQVPSGDLVEIIERCVDTQLHRVKKQRFGVGSKPRGRRERHSPENAATAKAHEPACSRHIPLAVRREVYERDGGQCTFVDDQGRRCSARAVELHHVQPFAAEAAHAADIITLHCRAHNQLQARRDFGADYVAERIEQAKRMKKRRRGRQARSSPENARGS
jgi:hypothetical protein